MFNGLSLITTIPQPRDDIMQIQGARQKLLAGVRYTKIATALTVGIESMNHRIHDYTDMRQFRAVVRAFGINRALMEFVNPKNRISNIISNLPSTETLDMIATGQTDPRTQNALGGLDEALDTEPGVIGNWINSSADTVDTLFDTTSEQIEDLDAEVGHYLAVFSNGFTDDSVLAGSAEAVHYSDVNNCIEALIAALPEIDIVVSDPTDRDAMDVYKEKLEAIVEQLGNHTGLFINPTNPHQLQLSDVPSQMEPTENSLTGHGYTSENLGDLLDNTKSLIAAVKDLLARKDDIVSKLRDAAVFVTSIDNDVPPAIDDAIADGEVDAEEALSCGMTTQADMVHCQVSSNLCCMSAALNMSLNAVHNTVAVMGGIGGDPTGPEPEAA